MNSNVAIRPTITTDIPTIAAIEKAAHIDPWPESILSDCLEVGYFFYSLIYEQQVIGYLIWMRAIDECHLLTITVHPDYQGRGFGRQLLEYVIQSAQQKHLSLVFLEVRESNVAAISLYEKFGFKRVGLRKNYYATPTGSEHALLYQLKFAQNE